MQECKRRTSGALEPETAPSARAQVLSSRSRFGSPSVDFLVIDRILWLMKIMVHGKSYAP